MIEKFEHYINNKELFIIFFRMAEHPTVARRHHLRLHNHPTLDITPLDNWSSLSTFTSKLNTHKRQTPWPGGIRTYYPSKRATADRPSTIWAMSLSCRGGGVVVIHDKLERVRPWPVWKWSALLLHNPKPHC